MEDDFEDWLDNSYSFSITLLNDRISPYEGLAHFSRHPPGPLLHGCLAQLAPYKGALPACLDSLSVTPVLIITDLDLHHNNLAIPHTVKACAKEDQIDRICDFLHDHVCPPDLSDSDYTSFVNVATRFFLLNRSLYCQEQHRQHHLVVPVEYHYGLIQEAHNSLRHKSVSFQSRCVCCCTSGGLC